MTRSYFLCAIALCVALVGCGVSDDAIRENLKSCEQRLGKLIVVADKIEFVDGRLVITRPIVDEHERAGVKEKSLLFSKSGVVEVNVKMFLSIDPNFVLHTGFSVGTNFEAGDVFVVDVDARGTFSEPRTEATTSLELAPP